MLKCMKFDETSLLKEIVENVNLIVVSPHGSSGSNLVQSILDNHSDIYMMPVHFKYPLWSEIYAEDWLNYWDGKTAITSVVFDFINSKQEFSVHSPSK